MSSSKLQGSQNSICSKRTENKVDTINNDYSSFSRLLSSSQDTAKDGSEGPRLKRRSSLFDNVSRSRADMKEEESSAFSFSTLTKEPSAFSGWNGPRRTGISNKRYRTSDSSSSNSSTSRSLFPPTLTETTHMTTVTETQNQTNFLKNAPSNSEKSVTPKASGSGQQPPLSNKGSLFGSVMQQVQQPQQNEKTSTPSKWKHHTPNKRSSAFTPESRRASMPFGSPGGFQLLDFVNSVASPFSKHSNHSNVSTKSAPPSEWQNTSVAQGVMDWSLPGSLRFDCHPGTVINPLLQVSKQSGRGALGLMAFLQTSNSSRNSNLLRNKSESDLGFANWEAGLLYWQHPADYPSPFLGAAGSQAQHTKPTKTQGNNRNFDPKDAPFSKLKKRHSSIDFAGTRPLAQVGNASSQNSQRNTSSQNNQRNSSIYKQQSSFSKQRRLEWQQAFTSLYWKWSLQLQQQRHLGQTQQIQKTYFYALGEDHAIFFSSDERDGELIPKIVFSASSSAFRNKLRQSGVQALRLLEAWNGHPKETVFLEGMIQQQPPSKLDANTGASSTSNKMKGAANGTASNSSSTASPSKLDVAKELHSPGSDSNSPKVEAELAALRRAQVFGETIGADVKVSIKPKVAAAQKLSLKTLPPLYVVGWDDCAAFFEVYLNLGSSCCAPYPTAAPVGTSEGKKLDNHKTVRTPPPEQRWQLPNDVSLLICRGVGPFLNSTMKSLTVLGEMQYPESKAKLQKNDDSHAYTSLEVRGGPILPCAIHDLVTGLVHTMIADKGSTDDICNRNSSFRKGSDSENMEDNTDDDAIVGSHNFILRVIPDSHIAGPGENDSLKYGLIGLPGTQFFNHGRADDNTDKVEIGHPAACSIQNGYALDMEVWDILHAEAMAYMLETVASPSTSALSLL